MSFENPIHNPEIERRAESSAQAGQALARRAEYVLSHYAQDHADKDLVKGYQTGELKPEVAYSILMQQAQDPLTGVQRRDVLKYIMEHEMQVQRESGKKFSIGYFDIDDFKSFNTDFDHTIGDAVLKKSAEVIAKNVRPTDSWLTEGDNQAVTRYGGEEFLVVYPNTEKAQATIPAERLRENFPQDMSEASPDQRRITLSGSVVEYDPDRHQTWEDMIQEASQLVLAAKAAGKNRILTELPEAAA